MYADAVFHQQHHELFSVHQGDGSFVGLSSFLDGSGTEITGGDDQPLLVCSEAATHLLNHQGQDVVLELPFLELPSNRISSKTQPQRKRPVDLHHGCFVKNADDFAYFFGRYGLNFIDHDL